MSMPAVLTAALGLAASTTDLRGGTVPNWLTYSGMVSGLAWYWATDGLRGAGFSLAGAAIGFVSLLVFFAVGGMGGGDVKLMAAFGALVGPSLIVQALIWMAVLGGIGAAGAVYWRGLRTRAGRSGTWRGEFIPYAPAISGGVWLTLLAS
jgi:prepilin peptidase CpaA